MPGPSLPPVVRTAAAAPSPNKAATSGWSSQGSAREAMSAANTSTDVACPSASLLAASSKAVRKERQVALSRRPPPCHRQNPVSASPVARLPAGPGREFRTHRGRGRCLEAFGLPFQARLGKPQPPDLSGFPLLRQTGLKRRTVFEDVRQESPAEDRGFPR